MDGRALHSLLKPRISTTSFVDRWCTCSATATANIAIQLRATTEPDLPGFGCGRRVLCCGAWVLRMYYLYMSSIVGKRQGNATYYYLVESARVDGKPRILSQQYLGSAEEVMAKLTGAAMGDPVRTQHRSFGDLAAVWSMLDWLGVAAVIDDAVPR